MSERGRGQIWKQTWFRSSSLLGLSLNLVSLTFTF